MSISSRITSMEEHIRNAYQGLQNIGVDITGVNKNIENISSMLEEAYKEAPKVSDTGTDITLDNTRKGRVDMEFSGNTSQETTTGKNFYSTSMLPVTEYGITISKNANGDIVLNGTPNFSEGYKTFYTGDVITVEAGTYTLSVANKIAGIGCVVGGFNGGCNLTLTDTVTSKTAYADTPQNVNPAINIRYDVGTLTNFVLNPQMEKSSSATTYEPFTNGASPNPDYPQEVHIVRGNNKINVVGKNLIPTSDIISTSGTTSNGITFTRNSDGSITANGTATGAISIYINNDYTELSAGTYTFSDSVASGESGTTFFLYADVRHTDSTGWDYYNFSTANTTTGMTQTIPEAFKFKTRIVIRNGQTLNNVVFKPMLEVGSSATTYEAYQGNTYNIDLPVENLLQCNIVSTTTGGVTITNNNNESFTLQGTATVGIGRDIHGEITLKAGTYTFSADHLPAGVYISLANVSNTILNKATPSRTFTISTDTTYAKCLLWIDSGYTVNDTIKIQLEKGSKQNNFTPYGINPIELGVIGTYKDKLIRTSGKNLFDNTYNDLGMWVTNIGDTTTFAQGSQYLGAYCKVEPGTYTISRNKKTNRFRIGVSPNQPTGTTSSCYVVASNDDASSITINVPQDNNYICVYLSNNSETSTNVDLMIEKGSTATEYNPYGTGEWYYKEAIKKVVLNGTETISAFDATSLSGSYQATFGITARATTTDKVAISDKFISALLSDRTTKTNIIYSYSDGYLRIATNVANTMAGFKTWLGTNNPKVLLEAATPTYNKITYEPLLEQLEAIYNAQGYDNQTNISQVNNDLPFIISASALKEWSV